MWVTKQNEETIKAIINIFAEKEYTVAEAKEILWYIDVTFPKNATVQKVNEPLFYEEPFVMKILDKDDAMLLLEKDSFMEIKGPELAGLARIVQKGQQG